MKKIYLTLLLVLVTAIVLGISAKPTLAATTNLQGWGWSSTIGWVDFSKATFATTETAGTLGGYAWSSNIGWISFNPAVNSNCPLQAEDGGNCAARVDLATGKVQGWARALAGCQNDIWSGSTCTASSSGDANGILVQGGSQAPGSIVFDYTSASNGQTSANGTYTYTVPAGVSKIKVQLWGAGGAGGSGKVVSGTRYPGMGGGAGGYGESIVPVTLGDQFIIDIGQGGRSATNAASTQGGFTVIRKLPLINGNPSVPNGSSDVMLQSGPGAGGVSYLKGVPTTAQNVTVTFPGGISQTFALPSFTTDATTAIKGGSATDCNGNPTNLYFGNTGSGPSFHGEKGFGQIGGSIYRVYGSNCSPLYYLTPLIVTTQAVVDFYTANGKSSISPWLNDIGGGSDLKGFIIAGTGNIYHTSPAPAVVRGGHPGGYPKYIDSSTPLGASNGGNGPNGEAGGVASNSGHGTDANIDGATPAAGGGGAENGLGGYGGDGRVIITPSSSQVISNGWDGWIHLSGTNHASPSSNGNGGVTFNNETGIFNGYAWGGDVVGWLTFDPHVPGVPPVTCPTCGVTTTIAGSCVADPTNLPLGGGSVDFTITPSNGTGPYTASGWTRSGNTLTKTFGSVTATMASYGVTVTDSASNSGTITCPAVTVDSGTPTAKMWVNNNPALTLTKVRTGKSAKLNWGVADFVADGYTVCRGEGGSLPNWTNIAISSDKPNGTPYLLPITTQGTYTLNIKCTKLDNPTQFKKTNTVEVIVSDSTIEEI